VEAISFFKYHGLGNDFIVVDRAQWPYEPHRIARLCDRHRGVGGDGALLVERLGSGSQAHARMVIFNRDGSRPEMCGNGVRCAARYLIEHAGIDADRLVIDTDAGPRACRIIERSQGPWHVEVQMGPAQIAQEPVNVDLDDFAEALITVDMGNPHAVAFAPIDEARLDSVGRVLNAGHPAFEEGVNVEFVEVIDAQHLRVAVFERGVGRTMACGTGACAAAAASIKAGHSRADTPVEVELPGGVLRVELRDDYIWMTGPAEYVFEGTLSDDVYNENR
jgi:diaminopimelate epimerase